MKQLWYMLQPGWTLKTLSLSRRQEGHTGPNHPVCFKSTKVSKRRENVSSTCRKRKPNHRGERLSHNWGKGEGEGWRWRVEVKGPVDRVVKWSHEISSLGVSVLPPSQGIQAWGKAHWRILCDAANASISYCYIHFFIHLKWLESKLLFKRPTSKPCLKTKRMSDFITEAKP